MTDLADILKMAGKFGKESVPQLRPNCNVGSFFDMITGYPIVCKWGNTLINGGLWPLTAIVGPNNSYKSTLSKHFMLAPMANLPKSTANTLDTEISGTGANRYNQLAVRYEGLADYDFSDSSRWTYTTNADVYGDVWWNMAKAYCKLKNENKKVTQMTTPFTNKEGEYIQFYIPTVFELDSLSQFSVETLELKMENAQVGSKERNMEDMASAKAKSKMIREMPAVLNSSGGFVIMTAHVGQQIDIDPYNPNMKKHQIMGNRTIKYTSGAFDYNMNNLFEIITAKPMINQNTKAPEFPRDQGDDVRGDTDLYELQIRVVRGKAGATGFIFPFICSQSEGVLTSLSDFYYLKVWKYGISGNNVNYSIDLLPDVSLSRTTVRKKIDSDPKLRRALRLQCDLLLLQHTHKLGTEFPPERLCTPKELYEDIKKLGYDWDELLNTKNEWGFREDKQEIPTLTIYDLLNMRAGVYKPYWMQEEWKKENKDHKFGMAP